MTNTLRRFCDKLGGEMTTDTCNLSNVDHVSLTEEEFKDDRYFKVWAEDGVDHEARTAQSIGGVFVELEEGQELEGLEI